MTFLGASCIFFFKKEPKRLKEIALGSSSGLMIGATFFSLLLPAIELLQQQTLLLFFLPISFLLGAIFVKLIHHLLSLNNPFCSKALLLFLVMTIHNFPEGLAVGIAFASPLENVLQSACLLSIGIGIQNFPEGLAVSLPMYQTGKNRFKSFMYGQASALIEIPAALLGYFALSFFDTILPYALSFSAGAMIYVVIEELIPEAKQENQSLASYAFIVGFVIMMWFDLLLG